MGVIEPFTIEVPQAVLDDLAERLADARYPDQLPDTGWDYGTDMGWLRSTAQYWQNEYDWRAAEARLNTYDHFLTTIDGQRFHFMHVRSPHDEALPLLLTHGWPGSVLEFLGVIDSLTDPQDPADAFHLVIPSLPGYGWSGPTTETGWDLKRTASAYAELMANLGYDRYGAQGGDWGSFVTRHLASLDAEHLVGIHVNCYMAMPPGNDDDMADLSDLEAAQLERTEDYFGQGSGYVAIQSTRPQSLAYGLNDSPVGLLSWIGEKFWAWTDNDGDMFDAVSIDDVLTNVMIYWVTGTIGSSVRMYAESIASGAVIAPPSGALPLGVANFPKEILNGRRRWVEAEPDTNLTHWEDQPRGGHFAALEQPELFTAAVQAFFRAHR